MSTAILTINNVRGFMDDEGVPQLHLEDVARGLGFVQEKSGIQYIRWERVMRYLNEFGFSPLVGKEDYVPENIFYKLCFKADNETAVEFQNKVTDEILPSIRKHGAYMTDETLEKALLSPDFLIRVAEQLKEEKEQRERAEAQLEANAPLVLFAETVQASPESILIGELSKMLKQRGINMGQKRLFTWLRDKGYLMRRGEAKNQPTQYSMERKLFELKKGTYTDSSGDVHVKTTTKVTGKGQIYFVNLFLKEHAMA